MEIPKVLKKVVTGKAGKQFKRMITCRAKQVSLKERDKQFGKV